MRFKVWFEDIVDKIDVQKIVLDALEVPQDDYESHADVLGSPIKFQVDLEKKITQYGSLKPYKSEIIGFIRGNGNKTVKHLVDFIKSRTSL